MSAFGTFRKAKNLLAHGSWFKELRLLAAPGTDQEMVKKTVTPTSTGVVRRLISYSSFIQGFQFVNAQAVMKPLEYLCLHNKRQLKLLQFWSGTWHMMMGRKCPNWHRQGHMPLQYGHWQRTAGRNPNWL